MSGLMPCPFCGGEAHIKEVVSACETLYTVGCSDSECMGFETLYTKPTVDEALTAWNRRAEHACRMVDCGTHDTCIVNRELSNGDVMSMEFGYKQCSECGAYVFDCPTVRYCPSCGARVVDE